MARQSLSHYDKMTTSPIPKLIIQLSIPTIISMLVTNIYNLADTAFVGQLGNSASGAVGIVFGFMAILQAIGFLFGQGAGSLIARALGRKDVKNASMLASTGFFCSFASSIVIAAVCLCFLHPLVMFLGSTETIAPYAKTYIAFILLSAPFITASFTLNNILRYEGKAFLGMIGLLTGAVLNIGGDGLFMFGCSMGIAGAGLSTAISQMIGFFVLLSMFLRKKTQCRLSIKNVRLHPKQFGEITLTGLPSLLRQALNSITTVVLNTEAAFYGDAAVSAMSIVSRIIFFVFSIALGVGQGFQPVSGFNYGAGKYSRVRKAYRFTFLVGQVFIGIASTVVLVLAPHLIALFRNDPAVVEIGTRALILQCLALWFLPLAVMTEMQFQSTGQKLGASILSILRNGVFFLPLLWILARFRGLSGIQEAQPLAYFLTFIPVLFFAIYFFRKLPKEDRD